MATLWQEYSCSICTRTVHAPVMWFNEPSDIVSRRYEDCGARYEVDNLEQTICPACYRFSECVSENGHGRFLTPNGEGFDPLAHVFASVNALRLTEDDIRRDTNELLAVLLSPSMGGKNNAFTDHIQFVNELRDVAEFPGEVMRDGWQLYLNVERHTDRFHFSYSWNPYYTAEVETSERHEVDGDKLLFDVSSRYVMDNIYEKACEIAHAIEKIFHFRITRLKEVA